jgi:hypothetical protein
MALFDDQTLVKSDPAPDSPLDSPPGAGRRATAIWIAAAIAAAVVIGALVRWWTLDTGDQQPQAAVTANAGGTDVAMPPPTVLPPLAEMDPFLRVLLGTLSARPELSRWLATDDLIRQMAVIIDRLSLGSSPAKDLRVLTPEAEFEIVTRGRGHAIDPQSYRRYDGLAETVATLDAASVARIYRTIKPRLSEAYRALGRSENDIDAAVAIALEKLASTPTAPDPIALREGKGATWAFVDPALEALDPAQKHLIRMGPANQARVQAKLKEIGAALQRENPQPGTGNREPGAAKSL